MTAPKAVVEVVLSHLEADLTTDALSAEVLDRVAVDIVEHLVALGHVACRGFDLKPRQRTQLLTAAIRDARNQVAATEATALAAGLTDTTPHVAQWRRTNPGLAALIDHSEGSPT